MKFGDVVYWAATYLGPVEDVMVYQGRVIAFDDREVCVVMGGGKGTFFETFGGGDRVRFMDRTAVYDTPEAARANVKAVAP